MLLTQKNMTHKRDSIKQHKENLHKKLKNRPKHILIICTLSKTQTTDIVNFSINLCFDFMLSVFFLII